MTCQLRRRLFDRQVPGGQRGSPEGPFEPVEQDEPSHERSAQCLQRLSGRQLDLGHPEPTVSR